MGLYKSDSMYNILYDNVFNMRLCVCVCVCVCLCIQVGVLQLF